MIATDTEDDSDDEQEEEAWTAYVDESSGYPYYYNKLTGQSQWEKPSVVQHRRHFWSAASTAIQPYNSSFEAPTYSSDSDDEIDNDEDVQKAVNWYVRSSLFHVVFIETPVAALEGFFKGLMYIMIGITYFMVYPLRGSDSLYKGRVLLRDGVRLIAAGLTLLIPGAGLFAYKDLVAAWRDGRLVQGAKVDNWYMTGIPSVVGTVDSRLFRTFSSGQGYYAINVTEQAENRVSVD